MVATADLIMFGLQGVLRLARAVHQARVEETVRRATGMPITTPWLPDDPASAGLSDATVAAASEWASTLGPGTPRESALPHVVGLGASEIDDRRRSRAGLVALYLAAVSRGEASPPDDHFDIRTAALTQWADDGAFPRPAQRILGAMAEVAIDYFAHVPGALDEGTRQGRAVLAFLRALDDSDFEESGLDLIVIDLFRAAAATVAAHPELISESEAAGAFLEQALGGVADEMRERIDQLRAASAHGDVIRERALAHWGRYLTAAIIRNAGAAALASGAVVDIDASDARALIREVGGTLLDLVVPRESDEGLTGALDLAASLHRLASRDGLDGLIGAALEVAAERPGLIPLDDGALRAWIGNILRGLHGRRERGESLLDDDLLGEVAWLAFHHGLRDLPGLLGLGDDEEALLVLSVRSLFESLATVGDDGAVHWDFGLDAADARALLGEVLAGLSEHAHWISRDPLARRVLAELLGAASEAIGHLGAGFLPAFLRSGRIETVIGALLSSGLTGQLAAETIAPLGALIHEVLGRVLANGVTGLWAIVESGALTDLLTAIGNDAIVATVTAEVPVGPLAEALASVVERLREGETLTLDALIAALTIGDPA